MNCLCLRENMTELLHCDGFSSPVAALIELVHAAD